MMKTEGRQNEPGVGTFRQFAGLLVQLAWKEDGREKEDLLRRYLQEAEDRDGVRVLRLLIGDRPARIISRVRLKALHRQRCPLPAWLQDECHGAVSDVHEAIALLEQDRQKTIHNAGLDDICKAIEGQHKAKETERNAFIVSYWDKLDTEGIQLFNRLLAGECRFPITTKEVIRAIAGLGPVEPARVAFRIREKAWGNGGLSGLLGKDQDHHILPLPFPEIRMMTEGPDRMQSADDWIAGWETDGRPVQLVCRNGQRLLWDEEHQILNDRYPEIIGIAAALPEGSVWQGLIPSVHAGDEPGRHIPRRKAIRTVPPEKAGHWLEIMDLLEWKGDPTSDMDERRRQVLIRENLDRLQDDRIRATPTIGFESWDELEEHHRRGRSTGASGIWLRNRHGVAGSPDTSIRFVWPVVPLHADAVLLYVQRPDGKAASQPQYSFALRNGKDLVTVARTTEGLDPADRPALEEFLKKNTLQRFGPVRTVRAELVFEIAFDAIRVSTRHKSGFVLDGVRIIKWKKGMSPGDIHTMDDLKRMAEQ
jgi:DNA ligase-1